MKQAPPTLIDTLYRASFSKTTVAGWTSNEKWRAALRGAKRFVLDDAMSTFLGELGTEAFTRPKLTQKMKVKIVDRLRMGARLPAEITWIEYNLRNCQTRSNELLERPYKPLASPEREGWLLLRHPKLECAFQAIVVSHDPSVDHGDGFNTWTFPVALGWTADEDTVLPWRSLQFDRNAGSQPSEVSTGVADYITDRAGFVFSDMLNTPNRPKMLVNLILEWAGVQRRMWALLSTINDLPVEMREVRAARGFFAKSAYRKFLDHRTVTLTVPVKLYTKVIRNALTIAHRRGGPVREHWRRDWRRPLSALCDHDWGADETHMFCTLCKGRKIWIHEHVRGDTSRGFVTHDYAVTHEPS
jgi:hypothetical protein